MAEAATVSKPSKLRKPPDVLLFLMSLSALPSLPRRLRKKDYNSVGQRAATLGVDSKASVYYKATASHGRVRLSRWQWCFQADGYMLLRILLRILGKGCHIQN